MVSWFMVHEFMGSWFKVQGLMTQTLQESWLMALGQLKDSPVRPSTCRIMT